MKDVRGNELKIGDKVIAIVYGSLTSGIITRIGEEFNNVTIDPDDSMHQKVIRYPHKRVWFIPEGYNL